MKIIEPFIRLLRGFVALLLVFMAGKCLFMACYPAIYGPLGGWEAIAPVLVHGLPMDCSMAAYFCALPLLIMTAGIWWRSPWIGRSLKAYTVIAAALIAVAFVADTALYGYWAFKLDTTALFYLTTSPAAAMASVPWWTPLCGLALVLLIGWGIYALLWRMWRPSALACAVRRSASTALMLLAAPLLVLAMRGGVTVSTMNLSSAYFSPSAPLNHAAVNPLFSFMYSATHQSHFSDQFRFYPSQQEAESIYADLLRNGGSAAQDTLPAPRRPELSISE
ncbi:MAG: LTA synthase family protein, partial [Muribaculaceae bacterium]|nr:LTA synthase family protein [Muribaculaceae bacterium]